MSSVSFSLTVKNAAEALEFYKSAFGAEEVYRITAPNGEVVHSEFKIGETLIFMSGESPEWHAYAMAPEQTASCLFSIAVEVCDNAYARAVSAGGEELLKPEDQFWGMRTSMIRDPYGYRWSLSQFIEEVSEEEMKKRMEAVFSGN